MSQPSGAAERRAPAVDVAAVRRDFPILERRVHGGRLVYLDSAATSQKPHAVIAALAGHYERANANIHRGIHKLAEEATAAFEDVRAHTARFIGAAEARSIVFTRNTTESLNLVAQAWGRRHLRPGDEVLLTPMEHHSNLVPWFLVGRDTGARVRHIPLLADGRLDLSKLDEVLTRRTRIVALAHASNVLGTINPVAEVAERAHRLGALVVVDGAQSVPHLPVDVGELQCDFLAFSAHKMLGPTGVGVLYARPEILSAMEPFLGGGEMIREVTLEMATWSDIPWRFEAGTPDIAGVVAFGAALDYLERIGLTAVRAHDLELSAYALERLGELGFLAVYGPRQPEARCGVVTFNDSEVHPHDLSTILDRQGIAIRAGHHCAQPLMRWLGVAATARASFYIYNDRDDVDALVDGLRQARQYFGHAAS